MVGGLCFSSLGVFLAIPFWAGTFPLRSQLLALLGLPCMLLPVSPMLPLRFFVMEFCHINYDVCWSGPLWVPLDWDPLCFLDLCDFFFHQIRGDFPSLLFQTGFLSLALLLLLLVSLLYRYYYIRITMCFIIKPKKYGKFPKKI